MIFKKKLTNSYFFLPAHHTQEERHGFIKHLVKFAIGGHKCCVIIFNVSSYFEMTSFVALVILQCFSTELAKGTSRSINHLESKTDDL